MNRLMFIRTCLVSCSTEIRETVIPRRFEKLKQHSWMQITKMVKAVSIQNLLLNNYDYSTFCCTLYPLSQSIQLSQDFTFTLKEKLARAFFFASLTHFRLMLPFCIPWKYQFYGSEEREHWHEWVKKPLKYLGLTLTSLEIIKQFEQLWRCFFKFEQVFFKFYMILVFLF